MPKWFSSNTPSGAGTAFGSGLGVCFACKTLNCASGASGSAFCKETAGAGLSPRRRPASCGTKHGLKSCNQAKCDRARSGAATGNPALPDWLGPLAFDWLASAQSENDKYAHQIRSSAGIAVFVAEQADHAHWGGDRTCLPALCTASDRTRAETCLHQPACGSGAPEAGPCRFGGDARQETRYRHALRLRPADALVAAASRRCGHCRVPDEQ